MNYSKLKEVWKKEEKALALDARNEYNRELRARTKNKLYNAQEIMSRAVEIDGKYHFDNLTKGEMDFLLDNKLVRLNELIVDNNIESQPQYNAQEIMSRAVEVDGKYHFDNLSEGEKNFLLKNGIILQNELNDGKQYNIGQQADRNFTSEINKDNKNIANASGNSWTELMIVKGQKMYITDAIYPIDSFLNVCLHIKNNIIAVMLSTIAFTQCIATNQFSLNNSFNITIKKE